MTDPVTLLQELGFGDYEARAYVALLQRSPLNGYELAKVSGIPRANVYAVLHKLEQRGAVVRSDEATGARFAPVPATELIRRVGHRVQGVLRAAQDALEDVSGPVQQEQVWTVRGYTPLIEHAHVVVESAQQRLLVAIWPDEARVLAASLVAAEARGVEVTTLCLNACDSQCGGCRGQVFPYRTLPESPGRWLVLVADGADVLAGEIAPHEEPLALRTRQRLLVELVSGYIRHSIALAAVLYDLGGRGHDALDAETYATLDALIQAQPGANWLEQMRELLREEL